MPIVTTRSVVLRTFPYSDTSKILRLMTLDHGPRSAIAKGARRPKSKFGGLIEPFAEGHATLYLKENRDLHTLSDFDLLCDRQRLGVDLERFAAASLLCELILRVAPEAEDRRLFATLVHGLDVLLESDRVRVPAAAVRETWRHVAALGFAPELARCVGCGRRIPAGEGARFDLGAGGLRCGSCGGEGSRLSPEQVEDLRDLAGRGELPDRLDPRQRRIVRDFVRYHVAEGSRLRSLDFLEPEEEPPREAPRDEAGPGRPGRRRGPPPTDREAGP